MKTPNEKNSRFESVVIDFVSAVYYVSATLLNYQYSVRMKLISFVPRQKTGVEK